MNASTKRGKWGTTVVLLAAVAVGGCQSDRDAQQAIEEANLAKAVYCMDLLENQLDIETADSACFAESYVQHAPHVPDGRDAVVEFFTQRIERYPESTIDIKRAVAKDDLVWIHLHSKADAGLIGRSGDTHLPDGGWQVRRALGRGPARSGRGDARQHDVLASRLRSEVAGTQSCERT